MRKDMLAIYAVLAFTSIPLYLYLSAGSSNIILLLILFVMGIYMLVKGSDYFVDGASSVAAHKHISQHVIGLTLVALATSLPEFAVSVLASFYGHPETSWGNVVGSNIANIGLVMGAAAILMPLALSEHVKRDATILFGVTLALLILSLTFGAVLWWMGVIFIGTYFIYLLEIFKREPDTSPKLEVEYSFLFSWVLILLGGFGVIWGAKVVILSAIGIAEILGIPEIIIAITAIAIGTSLPELVTSVMAAMKKKYGIAVGNVVGSNIFNILMVMGFASIVNPIVVPWDDMLLNSIFLLAFTGILAALCFRGKIGKYSGLLFLSLYALFIISLII